MVQNRKEGVNCVRHRGDEREIGGRQCSCLVLACPEAQAQVAAPHGSLKYTHTYRADTQPWLSLLTLRKQTERPTGTAQSESRWLRHTRQQLEQQQQQQQQHNSRSINNDNKPPQPRNGVKSAIRHSRSASERERTEGRPSVCCRVGLRVASCDQNRALVAKVESAHTARRRRHWQFHTLKPNGHQEQWKWRQRGGNCPLQPHVLVCPLKSELMTNLFPLIKTSMISSKTKVVCSYTSTH